MGLVKKVKEVSVVLGTVFIQKVNSRIFFVFILNGSSASASGKSVLKVVVIRRLGRFRRGAEHRSLILTG